MVIKEKYEKTIKLLPELYKENKLDILSDKKKSVIIKYYGLNGEKTKTYRELAKEFGWSKNGVYKCLSEALKILTYNYIKKKEL